MRVGSNLQPAFFRSCNTRYRIRRIELAERERNQGGTRPKLISAGDLRAAATTTCKRISARVAREGWRRKRGIFSAMIHFYRNILQRKRGAKRERERKRGWHFRWRNLERATYVDDWSHSQIAHPQFILYTILVTGELCSTVRFVRSIIRREGIR